MKRKEDYWFSISMANYNNASYIETAINSVINQTYKKWELIIVDDKSTDDSIQIVSQFLNDDRIKLIIHKFNMGYGASLRTAIEGSKYPIIGIVDSDDKLHEEALAILNKAYKNNPECGFIYTDKWICDKNLHNCVKTQQNKSFPPKSNIITPYISHFKTFKKSEYLKTSGFVFSQKRSVDKDIIYKLEEVTNFKYIKRPLYYYRKHEKGISQGKNKDKARLYHYIARCKAYYRRLNMDIPTCSLTDLYMEYFKLTFFDQISLLKRFFKIIKVKFPKNRIRSLFRSFLKLMLKFL